jgi:hypothetical protein
LAGFAVGSAVMAGMGRGNYGARQALSSRYSAFAVYLPLSLAAIFSIWAGMGKNCVVFRKCSATAFMAILVMLQLLAVAPAFHEAGQTRIARVGAKAALLMVNIVPDSDLIPALLYHTPEVLREEADELDNRGWIRPMLVGSDQAKLIEEKTDSTAPPPKRGGMERFGRGDNERLITSGWSVTADQSRPSDAVFLTYEDEAHGPTIFWLVQVGGEREDVAQRLGNPDLAQSGWTAVFPVSRIPFGTTPLTIHAWAFDVQTGTAFKLDGNAIINRQG